MKVLKKIPSTHTHLVCKTIAPSSTRTRLVCSMPDQQWSRVQKSRFQRETFVFLAFLWHPWKAGVLNMLLNFSFSSFVAGQGSLQPGKQREGQKEMIWWQGSTWVYLQIPLCSNKRPIYLFIAIYLLCSWSIQSGFKMSDSGKRQGFVSQL